MEELNSIKARKLSPIQRMTRLKKAVLEADARVRVHRGRFLNAHLFLNGIFWGPIIVYSIYHLMHPNG